MTLLFPPVGLRATWLLVAWAVLMPPIAVAGGHGLPPGSLEAECDPTPESPCPEPSPPADADDGEQTPEAPPEADKDEPGASEGDNNAEDEPAPKTIAELTKEHVRHDGLFTLFQSDETGGLKMVVRADQLGGEYIYFSKTLDGVAAASQVRGLYGADQVLTLRRYFDRIQFVVENTSFVFDADSALSKAADANISDAVVYSAKIKAEDEQTGDLLIDVDALFLSEALRAVKPRERPGERNRDRFRLGKLNANKTRVAAIRNYPDNTDVAVAYTFDNPNGAGGGREVTDPRYITITLQHTLIAMPDNGFEPRRADPRIGFFTVDRDDLTSVAATPYDDLITRWKLEKRDPSAALSEPVEPIVWWIENTTPVAFRETIRAAALAWNPAFEAIGFKDAIQVKVQPDDADWDAGDLRYNVLRWTSSPTPFFGGYGPSFVNPRTGQILGADIMLEYVFVTNRIRDGQLFSKAGLGGLGALDRGPDGADALRHRHGPGCFLGMHLQWQTQFGRHVALARTGATDAGAEQLRQSLYYLVLHELGHTLGLSHNMAASQLHPPERLHDTSVTDSEGLIGSVMDYPALNVAPIDAEQGQWWATQPGPYDTWAIAYGYSPSVSDPEAEAARLEALLARSTEPALLFGNDADDMRAPGRGIDPRIMVGDLSSDAVGHGIQRMELANALLGGLRERLVTSGESYQAIRDGYLVLSGQQAQAAAVISRYIGGIYIDRAVAGQAGGTQPFTPVPAGEQRRAMSALAEHVFAPHAGLPPAELIAYLQPQRRGFFHFGETEDPKVHDRIRAIQTGVLNHLTHPTVLTRMTDSALYGNGYSVAEMTQDLVRAAFDADLEGSVNSVRQTLQIDLVERFAAIANDRKRYDPVSRSAALYGLQTIEAELARVSKAGGGAQGVAADVSTRAHRAHLRHRIKMALEHPHARPES